MSLMLQSVQVGCLVSPAEGGHSEPTGVRIPAELVAPAEVALARSVE
jgi:hypothetical protein